MSHTNAPWQWSGNRLFRDNRPDGKFSSSTILVVRGEIWRPNDADARLIASAPELLEAAASAVTTIGELLEGKDPSELEFHEVLSELEEAIAKAEKGEKRDS